MKRTCLKACGWITNTIWVLSILSISLVVGHLTSLAFKAGTAEAQNISSITHSTPLSLTRGN